jgi:aryl-alcohol dehydrogenase-like predicted oxidoreductase
MEYSLLGRSGVRVSKISVGTFPFGVAPLAKDVDALVGRALELGVNFFDCANSYGNQSRFDRPGAPPAAERESAEEMLGRALKGRRHEVVLSTKVQELMGGGPNGGGPSGGGLTRVHMMQQVEQSLRRLQTDHIDVYHAHHPDPTTPLDQTMRVFDDLIRQGKVRYCALSTFPGWQVTEAVGVCQDLGLHAPVCHQVRYNLIARQAEPEVVPASMRHGISITCFNPVGGGILAGVAATQRPPRFQQPGAVAQRRATYTPEQITIAEKLEALGAEWGHPPAHLALAWLLSRPGVVSAITGPENVAELEEDVAAAEVRLDQEQLAVLDAIGTA